MKLKTLLAVAALIFSLSMCKSPTSPNNATTTTTTTVPATGTISGTVTETGSTSPISGASVSTQPATTTATTNSQGAYTLASVPPGSYAVTASASNHINKSMNITVTAGQTTTANLVLQADYSGNWSGTTSQGKAVSFTIVGNALTKFSFGFELITGGMTSIGTIVLTYPTPRSLSSNAIPWSAGLHPLSPLGRR